MSLDEDDRQIIYYSMIGPLILSVLGCLLIIIMYLKFTSLRSTSYTLILILTCFDLINAVGFLIPTFKSADKSRNCQVQAFLINFSSMASVTWTTFMAFFVMSTIKGKKEISKKKSFLVFIGILFGCLCVSIVPYIAYGNNSYGKVKGWCWIKDDRKILRLLLFFVPVLVVIPINFVIYLNANKVINDIIMNLPENSSESSYKSKLIMYPLIIFVCYIPYTVKAMIEMFSVGTNEFIFTIISGVMRSLHGFLNFLVYGINTNVQVELKSWISEKQTVEASDISSFSTTDNRLL